MISATCTAIETELIDGVEYAVIVVSVQQQDEPAAEKTWEDFRLMILGKLDRSRQANHRVAVGQFQLTGPVKVFTAQAEGSKFLAQAELLERVSYSTGLEVYRLFVGHPKAEFTHLIGSHLSLQGEEQIQQALPATALSDGTK